MPQGDFEERFWSKVRRRGPDECWLWAAGTYSNGYGEFYIGKRIDGSRHYERAHRVAFFLTHGYWPEPCCLHNCPSGDNPLCCNPAHLWEGTRAENNTDKVKKGRVARGERHSATMKSIAARGNQHCRAKLKEWQIPYIRTLLANGIGQRNVAKAYEVSPTAIQQIAESRTWTRMTMKPSEGT